MSRRGAILAIAGLLTAAPLLATGAMPGGAPQAGPAASTLPAPLREAGIDQRLGESVPLEARFLNHEGEEVALGDLLGERPAVLALVYYDCPMLCSLVLQGLTRSLRAVTLPDEAYDVVVVSFDPRETPADAARVRRSSVERIGAESGAWHFLTGSGEAVERLTGAVGFRYAFVEETGEFAHAAGIVVLTSEGRAARYLMGVDYPPRELRLALVEASEGRIGSVSDQILLYCFKYDPESGKYTLATLRILRLGGIVTVVALLTFLTLSLRRERRPQST